MKVLAINGSPRKKWNTAMLLENALKGQRHRELRRNWSISPFTVPK